MNQIKTLNIISILSLFLITTGLYAKQNTIQINQELELKAYNLTPLSTKIDTSKIIVLEFWATWCGPCIAAFPELENIQREFQNSVQIVAVSDESREKVEAFIDKKKYHLSFFVDPSKNLFKKFDISTYPVTAIVGKNKKLLWVGKSKDLRHNIINLLSSKKTIQITEDAKYGSKPLTKTEKPSNSFEYYVNIGKDSDPYMVRSQKIKIKPANITYLGATVTEILMDLLNIESNLRFTNHRKDLDKTIINMVAKSSNKHITYGMAINFILNDLKDQLKFQIFYEQRETEVYELKVTNYEKLKPFINDIPGGGYAEMKTGQLTITRLSLDNLANLFEKKLKLIVTENNDSNEKLDLTLSSFSNIEDLNRQLKKYGLILNKIQKEISHTIIK